MSKTHTIRANQKRKTEEEIAARNAEVAKIMEDYRSDNPARVDYAKGKMIELLDKFIRLEVKTFAPSFRQEWDDMIQEGRIAVLNAMGNYDPARGTPTTFFDPHIKHAVVEYKNKLLNGNTTQHYSDIANKVRKAINSLEKRMIDATPATIAIEANITITQAAKGLEIIKQSDEEHFTTLIQFDNVVKDREKSPEEYVIDKERQEMFQDALSYYPQKALDAFSDYYGINGDERKSYKELSVELNIPEKQVSAMVSNVIRALGTDAVIQEYYGISEAENRRRSGDLYVEETAAKLAEDFYDEIFGDYDELDEEPAAAKTGGSIVHISLFG